MVIALLFDVEDVYLVCCNIWTYFSQCQIKIHILRVQL